MICSIAQASERDRRRSTVASGSFARTRPRSRPCCVPLPRCTQYDHSDAVNEYAPSQFCDWFTVKLRGYLVSVRLSTIRELQQLGSRGHRTWQGAFELIQCSFRSVQLLHEQDELLWQGGGSGTEWLARGGSCQKVRPLMLSSPPSHISSSKRLPASTPEGCKQADALPYGPIQNVLWHLWR